MYTLPNVDDVTDSKLALLYNATINQQYNWN